MLMKVVFAKKQFLLSRGAENQRAPEFFSPPPACWKKWRGTMFWVTEPEEETGDKEQS
jgi:hypothetical protein